MPRTFGPVLLVACLATACARRSSDEIAVVPKGSTHEFWKSVQSGALEAAARRGAKVLWKGPLREDDREEQIRIVESLVNLRVRGLVLAPLDDVALAPAVTDAVRAGIPVVVFDSALKSNDVTSFVATDNRAAGRLGGEHLARLVGPRGRVILLRCHEGSASTAAREEGFLEAIAAAGVTVVSKNQYGGVTTESAMRAGENLLAAHRAADGGPAFDGVFCPNESTSFGMLRALEESGLAGRVRFVGFDSSAKLLEGLRRGHLDGLVVQDPKGMGALAVETMLDHLAGRSVPPRQSTGATLVTREK